jgi:hypothetical protein
MYVCGILWVMSLSDTLARQAGSVDLWCQSHEGGKVSKAESKIRWFYHVFLLLSKKGAMHLSIERLMEGNAKCPHLKNLLVEGLCGRCLSAWGPEIHTPPSHCKSVNSIHIHTGKRGESWTREKGKGTTVHKAGSKIPTWLTLSQVYKFW